MRAQIEQAQGAWRSRPSNPELCGRLGMILHAYRWLERAHTFYARAAESAPRDARWPYLDALALGESSPPDVQARLLEQAVELKPDFTAALLRRAELALQSGESASAASWFRRALDADPKSPHALAGLGQCLAGEGRAAEAREKLEAALALEPRLGRALYQLAVIARAEGDSRAADELLRRHEASGKRLEPPDPLLAEVESLRRDSDQVFRSASALFQEGRFEEAIAGFKTALERNPALAMAHYNIGLALQQLGRHAEAVPHYEELLKRQPGSPDALNNIGLALQAQGRKEEALVWFEKAVSAAPAYVKARINRAALWLDARRELDAARDLVEVLRIEPSNERAIEMLLGGEATRGDEARYRSLAAFLRGQGLAASAAEVLRRGLRERPGDWKNAVALAWLLATTSDGAVHAPQEAFRLVEPLVQSGTATDAAALDTLAAAHAARGRFDEAVRMAEEALRKATEEKQVGAIRARLELYRAGKPYRSE